MSHQTVFLNEPQVISLYESGLSLKKIAKQLSVGVKPVYSVLKRNNITRRQSTYTLNEQYFDNIDSSDKAYILGLIYADGCLSEKTRCVSIGLQEPDKNILEKINILLNSNRHLYIEQKRDNRKQIYKLSIVNKNLYISLSKLGLMPNKDLLIRFPNSRYRNCSNFSEASNDFIGRL